MQNLVVFCWILGRTIFMNYQGLFDTEDSNLRSFKYTHVVEISVGLKLLAYSGQLASGDEALLQVDEVLGVEQECLGHRFFLSRLVHRQQ